MTPIQTVLFVMFILPFLILKEGYRMFIRMVERNDWWWHLVYVILGLFIVLAVILYISGVR